MSITLSNRVVKPFRSAIVRAGNGLRRPRLRVEGLEAREVPSTYVWTGAANPQNFKWSDVTNWSRDNAIPDMPPGIGDDVVFDDSANEMLRSSQVDRPFTINT